MMLVKNNSDINQAMASPNKGGDTLDLKIGYNLVSEEDVAILKDHPVMKLKFEVGGCLTVEPLPAKFTESLITQLLPKVKQTQLLTLLMEKAPTEALRKAIESKLPAKSVEDAIYSKAHASNMRL